MSLRIHHSRFRILLYASVVAAGVLSASSADASEVKAEPSDDQLDEIDELEVAIGRDDLERQFGSYLREEDPSKIRFTEYWYGKQERRRRVGIVLAGVIAPIFAVATVLGSIGIVRARNEYTEDDSHGSGGAEPGYSLALGLFAVTCGGATMAFFVAGTTKYSRAKDEIDRVEPLLRHSNLGTAYREIRVPGLIVTASF